MIQNKRISRIIALVLACIMTVMMLAGCTSSSSKGKDKNAINTEFVDEDNRIDDKYGTT